MQKQEQETQSITTVWGVDKVVLETALTQAFAHHAIDNRGILTSPRRGRQVATQILAAVEKFLAFETAESDIAFFAAQLAEQGMAMLTGRQMMLAFRPFIEDSLETAVIVRLNIFQICF